MFASVRMDRRAARHRYSHAMEDGTAVSDKPLVRLCAWHYCVFAEGGPLGRCLDCTAAEVRFADGRISDG